MTYIVLVSSRDQAAEGVKFLRFDTSDRKIISSVKVEVSATTVRGSSDGTRIRS